MKGCRLYLLSASWKRRPARDFKSRSKIDPPQAAGMRIRLRRSERLSYETIDCDESHDHRDRGSLYDRLRHHHHRGKVRCRRSDLGELPAAWPH
jgi:hypothetical protein